MDITGIRAIAVISVILNHFNLNIAQGGFIGVDIFFVLSGYLITGNILAIGFSRASLTTYFIKRLRRIIPALYLMIVVSYLVSLFLLLPGELLQVTKSLIYIPLFLSNVFFWIENTHYFAITDAPTPFLHTWSLGVEEQFYLIFPFLLFAFYRIKKIRAFFFFTLFIFKSST